MATPRKENPQPGGRPTIYKPEYCAQLVGYMEDGLSFMASCGLMGFSKQSGHNWAKEYPEFFDAMALGQAKRSAFLERRGLNAESGPAVTFAVAALKNCNPDEFRENQRHEHSGPNGNAIETVTRIELVSPGYGEGDEG
jgi:transposase